MPLCSSIKSAWNEAEWSEALPDESVSALKTRLAEAEQRLATYAAANRQLQQSKEQLQRSEERMHQAQSVAKIGSWEFDPAAGRFFWSAEMFRLLGFDPKDGEPDYRTLMTHYHPDDVALHDAAVLQALNDGQPYEFDIRILFWDERGTGMIRWGHARGQAERDSTGRVVRLFGTIMDITERKQAEEENARLAAIIESSHDAVLAATLDGTLVSWNRSAERLFGYTEAEIIGQHLSVLAAPEEHTFAASVIQALQQGETRENLEVRRQRKDGTGMDLVLTFSPIRNPAGQMVGVAAICRDVTAERQAEEAVRQSEARLAEAQRVAHIGSWEVDARTHSVTFSEEMFCLFELDRSAGMPTNDQILAKYHPEDVEQHLAAVRRAMTGCTSFETDTRIVRSSGQIRWCHIVGEPIVNEQGTLLRLVGTMMDITDRMLIEERFRVLFDHSSEAHFFVSPHGIVDCNQAALHMLRCPDKAALLALHPRFLSPERQPDGRISAETGPEMEELAHKNGVHRFEWTHTRLDGDEFPTEITLTPVVLGGRQTTLAVWHDLTERKEAEQKIRDYAVQLELQKQELEQANSRLRDLATTDGLTGLKNHRAFQERLFSECETAGRHGSPLSLLLLDVDHFKQYNDAYGHPAGDAVLKQVARVLEQTMRDGDFAARYGGEEFVVILPQTDLAGAVRAGERCRARIEAAGWDCRVVTASFGAASLSWQCAGGDALLAAADKALYAAKFHGRNRVVSAESFTLPAPAASSAGLTDGIG